MDRRDQKYEQLFIVFSDKIEVYIKRMIIVLFILLLFAQFVLQYPIIRHIISTVDHLEGIPYRNEDTMR